MRRTIIFCVSSTAAYGRLVKTAGCLPHTTSVTTVTEFTRCGFEAGVYTPTIDLVNTRTEPVLTNSALSYLRRPDFLMILKDARALRAFGCMPGFD